LHRQTVKNIDKQALAEVQAERPLDGITVLGADEISVGQGHHYWSLFSALEGLPAAGRAARSGSLDNWKARAQVESAEALSPFRADGGEASRWDSGPTASEKISLGYIESSNLKARNVIRRAYGYLSACSAQAGRDKEYMKLKIIQTCTPWMAEFHPWSSAHSLVT
jgi:hypothetical protein